MLAKHITLHMSHTWISWGWIQAVSVCLLSLTPSPLSPFFFFHLISVYNACLHNIIENTPKKLPVLQATINGDWFYWTICLEWKFLFQFFEAVFDTSFRLLCLFFSNRNWFVIPEWRLPVLNFSICPCTVNGKCPYFPHCLNLVVKWCTSQVIVVLIRRFMRDLYQSCGYAGDILVPLMLLKSMGNLKENVLW